MEELELTALLGWLSAFGFAYTTRMWRNTSDDWQSRCREVARKCKRDHWHRCCGKCRGPEPAPGGRHVWKCCKCDTTNHVSLDRCKQCRHDPRTDWPTFVDEGEADHRPEVIDDSLVKE